MKLRQARKVYFQQDRSLYTDKTWRKAKRVYFRSRTGRLLAHRFWKMRQLAGEIATGPDAFSAAAAEMKKLNGDARCALSY